MRENESRSGRVRSREKDQNSIPNPIPNPIPNSNYFTLTNCYSLLLLPTFSQQENKTKTRLLNRIRFSGYKSFKYINPADTNYPRIIVAVKMYFDFFI